MKHPASTARPSELGGHRSMLLAATSRHCAQPSCRTVSTHCAMAYTPAPAAAAASRGKRGTAAARSLISACTAPSKAAPGTAEPLQRCVLPGRVDWSKNATLSYRMTQPSRMARPPLAAPQAAWMRAAAASKQATQSLPVTYGRHCANANAGAAARGSAAVAKPLPSERLARSSAKVEFKAARKAAVGVALYWLHPRLSCVACGSATVH